MSAYMGNTVYAIRCVCLCILCSGGHTGFVSLFIQNKKRERSEIIDRAKRRRTEQAARETSTLLWGKEKSTNKDLSDSEDLIEKGKSKKTKRKNGTKSPVLKKTKLLVKKPLKNLHVSKKCSKFAGAM